MAYRRRLKAAAAAAILGLSAAVSGNAMAAAAPGLAAMAPLRAPANEGVRGTVQLAQRRGRGFRSGRAFRRGYRRGLRRGWRRGWRRGYRRPWRRRWYGYRRPGYWIGPAIGAIIGGSIAASKSRYRSAWERCDDRYRSFRWSDGTFQPYGGGSRRLCPYLRN